MVSMYRQTHRIGKVSSKIQLAFGRCLLLALALAGCSMAGVAALPALASAAPVALDVPNNGAAPMVAYDPVSKVTFIAWEDAQSTPYGTIDLCVLPSTATTCSGPSGGSTPGPIELTITPTQNPAVTTLSLGGLTILPNGDVVLTGQQVYGGSFAWESPGDGSAFLTGDQGLQNTAKVISPVSLYRTPENLVALSDTDIGLLDDYDNQFADSPFAGPETPATLPNSNTNPPPAGQSSVVYPGKAYGTSGPDVAAEPLPAPATAGTDIVVGVGDNFGGPNVQLSDCIEGDRFGSGYGIDVGLVGASSHAGYLNAQNSGGDSIPAYTGLACNAETPVLASPDGGTQGIGVLENEGDGLDGGTEYTLDYRPFQLNASATGGSFGGPVLVANLTGGAGDTDVVDDSTDGVYAMWWSNGLWVNYSSNGGASWGPPVVIPEPASGEISHPVITAIGGGAFLLAYENNLGTGTQTFIQGYSYQALEQAPTAISTIQTSGTTSGAELTIPAGTIGESDRATITGTNASSANGTVDFALYNNSSCAGTATFTGSAVATAGTASIADGASPALAPGKYYWTASYIGNATNAASSSPCGSEVLTVTPPGVVPSTPPTAGGSATSNGSTLTLTITCSAACTVTVTITVPAATTASVSSKKGKKKPKRSPVVLGTAKFTLAAAGTKKLSVKLTAAGKKLLKKDHGHLKATLLLTDKTAAGTLKSTKTISITTHKSKKKKK
jgi:hypothetical protein